MTGAVDTRPEMTRAAFAREAAYAYDGWWLTGEDSFIHIAAVMQVEGWNLYGHPGNDLLTEPQRVLMMWSDLVGQTSNGGISQFVDNYEPSLRQAYRLIGELDWPDLFERFDRAFREQAGDPDNPKPIRPQLLDAEPELWAASRQRFLRHLARRDRAWWQPTPSGRVAELEGMFDDWQLQWMYREAVANGEIASGGERALTAEPPSTDAADAFDEWFYRDETKAASKTHVGGYITRHRDHLCRFID